MYMNTLIVNSIMIFNIFQNLQISNFSDVFLRKGNFTNGAQLINFKSGKIHKSILSQKDSLLQVYLETSAGVQVCIPTELKLILKSQFLATLITLFFKCICISQKSS